MAVGSFRLPITSTSGEWIRPADWLAMPTGITSADQTFVGLHAVFPTGQNYVAFLFTTSAGQYRVDWGDGTVTLHNSNTIAQKDYDYAAISNSTLTSRGYKQSMITVTAVSGNLLTCNFQQRFVTSPVQNQIYSTGFLDCILSMPNASSGASIVFGGGTVRHSYVERVNVLTIGGCTNMSNMFTNCFSLQSVPLFNTINVTNMSSMFNACRSLQSVPLFNTSSVTTMFQMFTACSKLQSVPLFNTSSVTTMFQMFFDCRSIQSVPLFNTVSVTNMTDMFNSCSSLQSVPLFNTSSVTNMAVMFAGCQSLNSIPALSTSSITTSSGTDFGVNFASACNSLNRCEMVFARTVSFQNCQLSRDAIVEIFNNLVDRTLTTSATITITGNWGASALTAGERAIATAKNWTITG
jgi:surface protein